MSNMGIPQYASFYYTKTIADLNVGDESWWLLAIVEGSHVPGMDLGL